MRKSYWAAAVLIAAVGTTLGATVGPASAASLPTCTVANTHCTNLTTTNQGLGLAGYYGADDAHTHYRYVQTVVTASASLNNLDGNNSGAVGEELCDPNDGVGAQLGLWDINGVYTVGWAVGTFAPQPDPCIQNGLITNVNTLPAANKLLTGITIKTGDQIQLMEFFNPFNRGSHFHQFAFNACDLTQGVCRQGGGVYGGYRAPANSEMYEFGIGAASGNANVTAGNPQPGNLVDTFSQSGITCYSCTHTVPISKVIGFFGGVGGLTEAQWVNGSSQIQMSPNDSLSGDTFKLYEGSTSA